MPPSFIRYLMNSILICKLLTFQSRSNSKLKRKLSICQVGKNIPSDKDIFTAYRKHLQQNVIEIWKTQRLNKASCLIDLSAP